MRNREHVAGRQLYLACGLKRFETRNEKGVLIPAMILQEINGKAVVQIDLKFTPHYILQHPFKSDQLVILDKGGPLGAIARMTAEKKLGLKYFKASSSEFSIYGHGEFFDEGRKFIGTERDEQSRGQLVIRDAESFEVLKTHALPGFGPHDCVFVDDGKLLAVAMDGMRSEGETFVRQHQGIVILFDVASGTVVKKIDSESGSGFGHLALHDGTLVALETGSWSDGDRGLLSVGTAGEAMTSLRGIPEINKWGSMETLSVAVDTKRARVILTNPMGNVVTIWDLKSKEFISHVEIPSPAGIIYSEELDMYVVTSPSGFIFHIDPVECRLKEMIASEVPGHFSSHLSCVYL